MIPILLVAGIGAAAFGFDERSATDALQQHHFELLSFVAGAPLLASLIFMAVCATAVAVSLPGVGVLTVVGGYLFGWLEGSVYVVIAATLAGTIVFVFTRSAFGEVIRARAGPTLERVAQNFRDNALSYVFILHLVPIFPSLMVSALPALCGVRLRTFIFSAFFGILPGTILFARLGSGLGHVLVQGGPIQLASFLTPQILTALAGLIALALLPVAWRAYSAQRSA
ncbi:MAG: TVP38/TMEM64 family protein [Geminicoccaceae bacterium]